MLKKEWNYYKHVFLMTINNPLRFWLSVLGFFIAIFVFALGNILITSYYTGKFESVNEIDEKSFFLEVSTENNKYIEMINKISREYCIDIVIGDEKETLLISEKEYNDNISRLVLSATTIGVSQNINGVLPVKYNEYEYAPSQLKIIKGRYIDIQDISQNNAVVVIDELTEKILFGDEDSIGKEIRLNANYGGQVIVGSEGADCDEIVSLKVIGVVENTKYIREQELLLNKYIAGSEDDVHIETIIYTPYNVVNEKTSVVCNHFYLWSFNDNLQYNEFANMIKQLEAYLESRGVEINICQKDTMYMDVEEEVASLKFLLYTVIVVLVIISGISTMNIMFFSIKERINEIGIKKALGATKIDIVTQFILEGEILGLLSGVIAVFLSIIVAKLTEGYVNNEMYIYFKIDITAQVMIMPIFLAILYSFIFSLVPSIYGAKINVTKALRFE